MARRQSPILSFIEGFNAGWDTVGKVGSAIQINRMNDEEEKIRTARAEGGGGLRPDENGNYSVFGMNFTSAPNDYDINVARNTAQADIYERWGDRDFARSLRTDALNQKAAGQTYAFNEAYNPLRLEGARLDNAGKGLSNQRTAQDIAFYNEYNPLRLDSQRLSNDTARQTYDFNEEYNPIRLDQARASLEGTRLQNTGTELNNTYLSESMADRLRRERGLADSAVAGGEVAMNTIDANIGRTVAESTFAQETLDPRVRQAFASADSAELAAAYDQASFQPRLDQLQTNLDISREQLDFMVESNPHRLQGMIDANILNALNIDEKTLDLNQRNQVAEINSAYHAAFTRGDYSGVEQNLMPFAAEVYNDPAVRDDDNRAVQNEDGAWVIQDAEGNTIGNATEILRSMPLNEQRDVLRQAQAYAVASITGNYEAINELYKTDAWIDYYQAQAEESRRGRALTKDQWALNRLQANPMDRLALALLLPADSYAAMSQNLDDPAFILSQGLGGNGGPRPGPLNPQGGGDTPPPPPAPSMSDRVSGYSEMSQPERVRAFIAQAQALGIDLNELDQQAQADLFATFEQNGGSFR